MEPAPLGTAFARGPEGGRALWLRTSDGVRLRMACWPGPVAPRGTVILLPGRTEYVEKYGPAAVEFAARGFGLSALDWRGQGLSDRFLPDARIGHVERFSDFQTDFDAWLAAIAALDLPKPWLMVSHSMGGAIALRRLERPHPFRAAVFSAPMWGLTLPQPLAAVAPLLATALAGSAVARIRVPGAGHGAYVMESPFADNLLTSDREMWDFLRDQAEADPRLVVGGPSLNWTAQAILEYRSLARIPSPALPCLTVLGAQERIVSPQAIRDRMAHWPGGHLLELDGVRHEVMMEGPAARQRFYDAAAQLFASV